MNKLYFFCFLFFISFCAHASAQTQNRQFDSIAHVVDEISSYQNTKTKILIDSLYQIAHRSPDSLRLIAHCLCKEAKWSADQGILDDELPIRIEKHAKKLESTAFALEKALLQYAFGQCRLASGEYAAAFEINLQALEQFKTLHDTTYISKSLQALGHVNLDVKMSKLSREYFREALLWVPKNSNEYYKTLYNIYLLYAFEGNMETLIDSMQYLITLIPKKEPENLTLLIMTYNILATAYNKTNQPEIAGNYFNKVEQQISHIDNPYLQSSFYNNYAIYLKGNKEYKKALKHLTIARQLDEQDNNIVRSYSTYSNLATLLEILGEKDSALFYLKKKDQVSKKIIVNNRAIEIYRQYIETYLQATRDKLTLSEQQVELRNKQLLIITTTSLLGASILLFFMLLMRQKKRRKEAENRELSEQLKVEALEKEKMLLIQQKQQEQIEAKERELASSTLLISNINILMQRVLKLVVQIRENKDASDAIIREIEDIIHQHFNAQQAWDIFKKQFEKVHPDFFKKLREIAPKLTEENLRLCTYFKAGISIPQASQILNVTTCTITTTRYRVKKKLGLSEDDDLDVFLREL